MNLMKRFLWVHFRWLLLICCTFQRIFQLKQISECSNKDLLQRISLKNEVWNLQRHTLANCFCQFDQPQRKCESIHTNWFQFVFKHHQTVSLLKFKCDSVSRDFRMRHTGRKLEFMVLVACQQISFRPISFRL